MSTRNIISSAYIKSANTVMTDFMNTKYKKEFLLNRRYCKTDLKVVFVHSQEVFNRFTCSMMLIHLFLMIYKSFYARKLSQRYHETNQVKLWYTLCTHHD